MILAILLQAGLFQAYTEEAAASMRVPTPIVRVVPVTPARRKYMAWVGLCPRNFDCGVRKVFITNDVTTTASPNVLRYLAYHEVCHISEGHYWYPPASPWVNHMQVDSCLDKTLGREKRRELERYYQLYSPYLDRLRALK